MKTMHFVTLVRQKYKFLEELVIVTVYKFNKGELLKILQAYKTNIFKSLTTITFVL